MIPWHALAPDIPEENALWRLELLDYARNSPFRQSGLRRACAEDPLFYVNAFCIQYNPDHLDREIGPFVTWPKQEEAVGKILAAIERRRDLCIEKSRKQGASWLCLLVMDWMCRFRKNKQFLLMSRDADAVDAKGRDSLFWKLQHLHDYLPDWLKGDWERTRFQIDYKNSGGGISGEASTGKAGVGGRATIMFIDEFAQIKDDYEVLGRTSETARTRIFNSTHKGADTAFFDICQRPDMDRLVMHWTDNPEMNPGLYANFDGKIEILDKQHEFPPDYHFVTDGAPTGGPHPGLRSPAYDEMCLRKPSPRDVAMDYDIDPTGSTYQFMDRVLINSLKRKYAMAPPLWEGDVEIDKETARVKKLTRRPGGHLKLWRHLDHADRPPEGKYGAGADVSTGSGASNSCLSIACATTGDKVLEYVNSNLYAVDAAVMFVALCRMFVSEHGERPLFVWEANGPGIVFGKVVVEELKYAPYWTSDNDDYRAMSRTAKTPGWFPNVGGNKRRLLDEYYAALRKHEFLNRSAFALDECLQLEYSKDDIVFRAMKSEDPSGARANHGDRVIADALANKMIHVLGRPRQTKIDRAPQVLSPAWRYAFHEKQMALEDQEIEA